MNNNIPGDKSAPKSNLDKSNDRSMTHRMDALLWREKPSESEVDARARLWWEQHYGAPCPVALRRRVSVNYLRHVATTYEHAVKGLSEKSVEHDAIKIRVLGAIADAYPSLAADAQAQASDILHGSDAGKLAPLVAQYVANGISIPDATDVKNPANRKTNAPPAQT